MNHALPLILLAGLAAPSAAEAAVQKGPLTVEGEVVDVSCYLVHGAHGRKHERCAQACVANGAPIGLLSKSGQLYLLIADHSDEKPYEDAKGLAGLAARVTGKAVRKNGMQGLLVARTEKPGSEAAAAASGGGLGELKAAKP